MPKIDVRERDLSWYYRTRTPGQLTVLMPGMTTWGPEDPVLVDSNNFVQTLGVDSIGGKDISYHMAKSLTEVGINVLFLRVVPEGAHEAKTVITCGSDNYKIVAKYKGTFGNRLKISCRPTGSVKTFTVCDASTGRTIESLVYDFNDVNSPYWCEEVNRTSAYIEVVPTTEPSSSSSTDVNAVAESTTPSAVIVATLTGGANGPDDFDSNDYSKLVQEVVNKVCSTANGSESDCAKILKDLLVYDFNIAVDGGYNDVELPSVSGRVSRIDETFLDIVKSRGSAVYLVSGSSSMSSDDFYSYCGLPSENVESSEGFNTSYAAAFGPWSTSQFVSNGSVRQLPGYYPFLIAWGKSLAAGTPMWKAPAGTKRASLGGIVKATNYPVGSAILDQWQNQDYQTSLVYSHKVNPIMNLKSYGYVVYGNSTLLKSRYDGSTSMLQLFSVRILANMIKSKATDISLSLQFDHIDTEVFTQFKVLMSTFMDQLKYGKALYDYEIIADRSKMTLDDLNSRTVPVRIRISPNPTAENFVIDLEISQAGIAFGDDTDYNTADTTSTSATEKVNS